MPFALQEQALHILFNATSMKEPQILSKVCSECGLVSSMQRAASIAHHQGPAGMDGLSLAMGSLTNLAEGCPEGRAEFVRGRDGGVQLLMSLIDGKTAGAGAGTVLPVEVKIAAGNALLALCTSEPSRGPMLEAGARRSLEAIASASWSTDVIAARAKQALRELA